MPALDVNDPKVIKFLNETYEKTARLRMKWNIVHADKLKSAATMTRKGKSHSVVDIEKTALLHGLATTTRDYATGARHRKRNVVYEGYIPRLADLRTEYSIPKLGLGDPKDDPRLARADTDLSIDPIMRPVKPDQSEIIYKNQPEFGRKTYLKVRYHDAPEEKFYFPESESWVLGWRLADSGLMKMQVVRYGRTCPLTRGCSSRTGPQPDPDYYKSPEFGGKSNCG